MADIVPPQSSDDVNSHPPVDNSQNGCTRCPPKKSFMNVVTLILLCLLFWSALWSVVGADALPGGNLFALFVLVILGEIAGFVMEAVHLPCLLGMLLMGFLLRNVPCDTLRLAEDIFPSWSASLRSMALVVILLQAGLGLDAGALKALSVVCIRLSCLPCIAEAVTAAVASHFILGLPWLWGLMLGFVLAAVTPAVIVPSLMSLQAKGYGKDEGIPTLIIAAASCDDVLAISGFGVIMGMALSTGNVVYNIFKGPLELVIGLLYGVIGGVFLWYIPNHNQLVQLRSVFLVCGGLLSVFGSDLAGFPGAGALGCLTIAFLAGHGWKGAKQPVERDIGLLWLLFQPLLFGLIGAEISLTDLDPSTLGLGILTLFIGLIVRTLVSTLAVTRAGLNMKEKIFIAVAWLPKATVQAAIGSVALDKVKDLDDDLESYAIQILTIAVLSILITAPLGAILITLLGSRLLQMSKQKKDTHTEDSKGPEIQQQEQETLMGVG